jgi:hypothetical protein
MTDCLHCGSTSSRGARDTSSAAASGGTVAHGRQRSGRRLTPIRCGGYLTSPATRGAGCVMTTGTRRRTRRCGSWRRATRLSSGGGCTWRSLDDHLEMIETTEVVSVWDAVRVTAAAGMPAFRPKQLFRRRGIRDPSFRLHAGAGVSSAPASVPLRVGSRGLAR